MMATITDSLTVSQDSSVASTGGVYHDGAYLQAASLLEPDGRLHVFRHGAATIPLILRPLPAGCGPGYDARSPYDFSGPLLCGEPAGAVWSALGRWASKHEVVTGFFRFHPLIDEIEAWRNLSGLTLVHSADNVVIELAKGETMLSCFKRRVARDLKVADRAGVTCSLAPLTPAGLDAFVPLYHETMSRRRADTYYYFDRRFFDALPGGFRLAGAYQKGAMAAGALILLDGDRAYYYLAASNEEGRRVCAMNALVVETAIALHSADVRLFHLGGGGSSLRAFKERFGPARAPYRVGQAIFDAPRHDRLVAGNSGNFFPAYRAG